MDFSFTDDHLALQDAVRRFCDREYPAHERGNAEDAATAARRWRALAELGLLGLPFDPSLGGSGGSAVDMMLVAQELGRCLGGGAWLANVALAGPLLADAGTPAQRTRWLPALAEGRARLALAYAEDESRYTLSRVATQARRQPGGGWRLSGRKTLVLDGDGADALLVLARDAGAADDTHGLSLFLVEAHAPGVQVRGFGTLDAWRAAQVTLDGASPGPEALVGTAGQALPLLQAALDRAVAALCGEACGALEALVAMTGEHLKTRRQFGAPLAKFQGLQHRIADLAIALEQCRSMACAAAMAVDAGEPAQRQRLVSAAKVLVGQAARRAGQEAIQMHGAMGMTDESRVGHYAKRLLVISQLFGDAAHHRRQFSVQESNRRRQATCN